MTQDGPALYSIKPGLSFVDALARGLLDRWSTDPIALSSVLVLLPNRRACRTLGEAFLRATEGRPLVLPRLMPLGDLDADELALGAEEVTIAGAPLAELLPATPPLKRALMLSRLVLAWAERSPGAGTGSPPREDQAARLALELARLIDQVETEGLSFEALETLVPEDYAEHWQTVLSFLKIVSEHWPTLEAAEGTLGQAARRRLLLEAQAEAWQRDPPDHPVVVAGSTGSIPATATLIATVARLPQGLVVLPGLDQSVDDDAWAAIGDDPDHPQHGLARLLRRLEATRSEVADWPAYDLPETPASRSRFINQALLPATRTAYWRETAAKWDDEDKSTALRGVRHIECPGIGEEATVIALLLREALETAERRAALVTPDRTLARRVAAELERWGIDVDDSAGIPLADTPPGVFLRLTADMVAQDFAPLALLAALKHPLAAGGLNAGAFRALARRLEIAVLRGPRPAPGLASLRAVLKTQEADPELVAWLDDLTTRAQAFIELLAQPTSPLSDVVSAHLAFAESLATSADATGAERLWSKEAGEATAEFLTRLLEAAGEGPALAGERYPALLGTLMQQQSVRPQAGLHPRLAILGPLEARLLQVDLIVLGGLNEGTWPSETDPGPWLSRPMRRDFGLPPVERRIGLQAHDFAQAFAAPEVVLTRSTKVEGAPNVPSRWLLRIEALLAILDGTTTELGDDRPTDHLNWAEALDTPDRVRPQDPPAPRPPVAARPRQISVTQVETWMRDPYALYAAKVLGLRALDPLDADLGAAARGLLIHEALERFIRAHPSDLPDDPEAALLAAGRDAFDEFAVSAGLRAYWWPRYCRIANWFLEQERARRLLLRTSVAEVRGRLALPGPEGEFVLTGTADRIDLRADGRLAIIDYKTGAIPSAPEIDLGLAGQLPLEAAMAAQGGFAPTVPAAEVAELAHWRLTGGATPGEVKQVPGDPTQLAEQALAGLSNLIVHYDDPSTPYPAVPRQEWAPRYSDYGHLERLQEWATGLDREGRS